MTLKHLLSFFLILVLFSASLCYAQHKMLRTKEDIQAFNDTMLFSLKENRHAAFSAGISDVRKSLGAGEVTTKMTDYWKNISKQCGALNEVKAYGVTTVDARIVRLSYLMYYELRPIILNLTYYKVHDQWGLLDLNTKDQADYFFQ